VRPIAVLLAALTSSCLSAGALLTDGKVRLAQHDLGAATRRFDEAAAKTRSPAQRVEALTLAADTCEQGGDVAGARRRLEAAITPDIPGSSEPALYALARLLETSDRPRALNLYYRAASGAERHRARGFPYHEATTRLLVLSQQ